MFDDGLSSLIPIPDGKSRDPATLFYMVRKEAPASGVNRSMVMESLLVSHPVLYDLLFVLSCLCGDLLVIITRRMRSRPKSQTPFRLAVCK